MRGEEWLEPLLDKVFSYFSEYGDEWHKAGINQNKQNVFDDFIAAGEYLVNNKYTSSNRSVH